VLRDQKQPKHYTRILQIQREKHPQSLREYIYWIYHVCISQQINYIFYDIRAVWIFNSSLFQWHLFADFEQSLKIKYWSMLTTNNLIGQATFLWSKSKCYIQGIWFSAWLCPTHITIDYYPKGFTEVLTDGSGSFLCLLYWASAKSSRFGIITKNDSVKR